MLYSDSREPNDPERILPEIETFPMHREEPVAPVLEPRPEREGPPQDTPNPEGYPRPLVEPTYGIGGMPRDYWKYVAAVSHRARKRFVEEMLKMSLDDRKLA